MRSGMSLTYPLLDSADIHQMLPWVNIRFGRDQGRHELWTTMERIDLCTDDTDSFHH